MSACSFFGYAINALTVLVILGPVIALGVATLTASGRWGDV